MTVKYLGKSDPLMLLNGKVYDVLAVEGGTEGQGWYRVVDETGEDYLFHPGGFEIVDDGPITTGKVKCPVCREGEFLEGTCYGVCPVCGWRDDHWQNEHPEVDGCANSMSLNQARKAWKEGDPIQ